MLVDDGECCSLVFGPSIEESASEKCGVSVCVIARERKNIQRLYFEKNRQSWRQKERERKRCED